VTQLNLKFVLNVNLDISSILAFANPVNPDVKNAPRQQYALNVLIILSFKQIVALSVKEIAEHVTLAT